VNRRALGCGTLAAAAFILVGVLGISRALTPAECPPLLPYEPASFRPAGDPTAVPTLSGVRDELVLAGRTSFGMAGWDVWVEPGRVPATADDALPQRIVLDCRDGTYQAYQRGTE
jgi:hypothetical protein